MMCGVKLRRLPSFALLALAACAGKAPSGPVASPRATPAAPVDGGPHPSFVARALPTQSGLRSVINDHGVDIQKCYQDALVEDHSLTHGEITVRVAIETSGRVQNVELQGPPEFRSLERCINERIGLWSFPPAGEQYGTEFVYVFQGIEANTPPAPEAAKTTAVDSGLTPDMAAKYIRARLPQAKACYESSLKTNPTLAGQIVMHWTIDTDAAAQNVLVESNTMQASSVPDCLRSLIEAWRFPKPPREHMEIRFPFVFQTSD
jgi:hypothetical protein